VQVGVNIVKKALEEPARQIANNAGVEGLIVVRDTMKLSGNEGFNAATCEFCDLVKAGIIDPAKVAKTALLNAASISSLLLTTEAMVTEVKEKSKKSGGGGGGDYDGMDM
jgi:chaperonin GroEL